MAYVKKLSHLPPDCGVDLHIPLLHNPYQQEFQRARRMRLCLNCHFRDPQLGCSGLTGDDGTFTCPKCKVRHVSNLTAPRMYDHLLALAGRGGGKTLIGAHAVREELMVPNGITWIIGPTHKILHDSTLPTLVRLIPPDWVKKWDSDNQELRLRNGHLAAFRSVQDNPDRARGPHGVSCGWFDEAAQSPERAYDVFEPTLTKAGGIVIASTTVLGYDWTYDKIERPAMRKDPGFFAIRWWSEENPLFASNPVMKARIERAKLTMTPEFYAQEYKAERRNAEGLVYDYSLIEAQVLETDDAVKELIPEWPQIHSDRKILIGLDEGADHPFGAVKAVVTEQGIVIVDEYLKRMKALSQHRPALMQQFLTPFYNSVNWFANKNALQLKLEFAVANSHDPWSQHSGAVQVAGVESKQEIGIQRVSSWLHTRRLYFVRSRCPLTIEQMQAYRYIDNTTGDGQKREKEQVFKKKDELPDAVRYLLMGWPELPQPKESGLTDREKARWKSMDERTRYDVERVREYNARERQKEEDAKGHDGLVLTDFFGAHEAHDRLW